MNIEGRLIEDVLDDEADHSTGERDRAVLMRLAAWTIRQCRAAGFVTPEGEVRKMCPGEDGRPSTLDLTEDGYIVGRGAKTWRYNKAADEMQRMVVFPAYTTGFLGDPPNRWFGTGYSTLFAALVAMNAEAARKAGEGGQ